MSVPHSSHCGQTISRKLKFCSYFFPQIAFCKTCNCLLIQSTFILWKKWNPSFCCCLYHKAPIVEMSPTTTDSLLHHIKGKLSTFFSVKNPLMSLQKTADAFERVWWILNKKGSYLKYIWCLYTKYLLSLIKMPHYKFKFFVNLKLALVRLKKNISKVPFIALGYLSSVAAPAISPYSIQTGSSRSCLKRHLKDQQKITNGSWLQLIWWYFDPLSPNLHYSLFYCPPYCLMLVGELKLVVGCKLFLFKHIWDLCASWDPDNAGQVVWSHFHFSKLENNIAMPSGGQSLY